MKKLASARKSVTRDQIQGDLDLVVSKLVKLGPEKVYLVGSAARNQMTDQSDIDLVVVFMDSISLRVAQKALAPHYPLCQIATELIWMIESEFERKKNIGGIAFEAVSEGELLWDRTREAK